MREDVKTLFDRLADFDPTLRIRPRLLPALRRRRIVARAYRREELFSRMTAGRICLFRDYPAPIVGRRRPVRPARIASALEHVHRTRRFRVRCGPSGTTRYMTTRDLMERWREDRGILGVTDLHIRDTRVEKVVDPAVLSRFNLLPKCAEDAASLEMMTMVVSSSGCVSDSHSDAPDGSNHCFTGRKVWLMWDTFEGLAKNLEDCERTSVTSRCAFDMETFLGLRSSRWLTISPGETLFLPGDYTHKVVTMEKYLGVGSFYVSLPNLARTLTRWLLHGPLWAVDRPREEADDLMGEIADVATRTADRVKRGGKAWKQRWGYDFLPLSLESWRRRTRRSDRERLREDAVFRHCMDRLAVEHT